MSKTSTELATRLQTGTPTRSEHPLNRIKGLLEANKDEIAKALPKHVTADRLLKTALGACRQNPELLNCSTESLLGAIMVSAELGLEPGPLGHCYLIPYNTKKKINGVEEWVKEVQFQLGYKGMLELVYRAGSVSTIVANPVYANELGHIEIDRAAGTVTHPYKFLDDPGDFVGVYAYAVTKDGMTHVEPMPKAEVEKIRKMAKSAESPAWRNMYEEMARKVVLKRLMKRLPMSVEKTDQIMRAEIVDESIGKLEFTPRAEVLGAIEHTPVEAAPQEVDWEEVRKSTLKKQAALLASAEGENV